MSLMPAIAEADEDAELNDTCTGADVLPQTTLAQMRAVLGRCGAGLDGLPADAAGALMEKVDRPLMVAQVSKGWRAAVRGALPRAPLRYVADYAKYHASTSTDRNAEVLADLAVKCGQYDVVSITITQLNRQLRDARALTQVLPRCPNLVTLDLSRNTTLEIETFTAGLAACTELKTLDLTYVQFAGQQIRSLVGALPPGLQDLRLRGVGLTTNAGVQALEEALRVCTGLTHLDLRSNRFQNNVAVSAILGTKPALVKLKLSGTRLHQEGLRDAAHALLHCTALTHLDVGNAAAGDPRTAMADVPQAQWQAIFDAGDEFLDMLPMWPALQNLCLEGMYFTDDASHLAASLHALPGLTKLDLSWCPVGARGITSIAAALPGMTGLTNLDLHACDIDAVGCQALVAVLPQCGALAKLHLGSNWINAAACVGMAEALQRCPNLTQLRLGNNHMDEATVDRIVAAWRAQHEPRGTCWWTSDPQGVDCTATHFDAPA
jgi:hypothetical protein